LSSQKLLQDTILSRIVELARDNTNVAVLWLYGSRAKGTAQVNSDYDLAVAFNRFPENLWDRRLQPELLAMEWADDLGVDDGVISVVDINHTPLPLALSIITTGEALLVKDSLRLAKEENRITSMWEIDHEYHRRHYG
jgi:predicted nucleotidyltransferase